MRQEQAVTITGYERAELLPVPADSRPLAPSEVSGRTLATMISPGTELAACYQGSQFPAVPGYAAVFAVEQVGAEVTGIKMGDRCFCMGPHRSFQRTGEREAIPVPEGLASEQAVLARAVAISMTTLATTTARPPDRVLVTGLGLVGHLAALVFRHAGRRRRRTACARCRSWQPSTRGKWRWWWSAPVTSRRRWQAAGW